MLPLLPSCLHHHVACVFFSSLSLSTPHYSCCFSSCWTIRHAPVALDDCIQRGATVIYLEKESQ